MCYRLGSYQRKILYTNNRVQLVETTWNLQAATGWHDHAESNGVSTILRGKFREDRLMDNGSIEARVLEVGDELSKKARTKEQSGTIHRVTCISDEGGIIAHLYHPPLNLKHVRHYDENRLSRESSARRKNNKNKTA